MRWFTNGSNYSDTVLPGTIVDETEMYPGAEFYHQKVPAYPVVNKPIENNSKHQSIPCFRDNIRQIDYILAYEEGSEKEERRRKTFHKNLVAEGLELEFEDKADSESGQIYYVKIHAPWDFLAKFAEVLKLKKPVKNIDIKKLLSDYYANIPKEPTKLKHTDIFTRMGMKNPFKYNENLIPAEPEVFTAGFQFNRQDMFLIKDRAEFFSQSQRSLMVWDILKRTKYSSRDLGFGIARLLANDTYLAAYPLHDGPYDADGEDGKPSIRRLLYLEWGRPQKWYKQQPLHLIRHYFGDKMAMYYAWLGFYTSMLIPAAIMGTLTFICGVFFLFSDYNKPSDEICNNNSTKLCPLCDIYCDYEDLSTSCLYSKISAIFDNPVTVFFSIAMSFWATMFLELWKRKENVIQWQWDLENFEDEEEIRPEYEESVKTTKINPLTKKIEPYLSFASKVKRYIGANSVVFFMLLLVGAAMFAVILYRLIATKLILRSGSQFFDQGSAKLFTSMTAASLNLCLILVLNFFYEKLVFKLVNMEMPRTQTEYEDSFTLKMFMFQFINFYSSLIYIAFFKGRFFYHPGDEEARTNIVLELRYDMCDTGGCFTELFVQLSIIMVGKQVMNNVIEILLPVLKIWWNKRQNNNNNNNNSDHHRKKTVYTRWEQDYDLSEYTRLSLFNEYLEMVIQYGFVTLFVAAFPLAPLFALLNNIVEIRLDAYKYLTKMRRPLPQRVEDIGIWFNILKAITYMAVLSNALVISYTSDFIPKLVYMYGYSPDGSLTGYVGNSFSDFATSEYKNGIGPDPGKFNDSLWPATCSYLGYRNPPSDEKPYDLTLQFWHVFTARMVFIFFFEHIVILLTRFLAWAIPDIPVEVKNQILMEKKVQKDMLFEAEMKNVREERNKKAAFGLDLGSRSSSRASMVSNLE